MVLRDMHEYEVESLVRIAGEILDRWSFLGGKAVIRNANAALSLQPNHVMALLLRAKAKYFLGEWEDSICDFLTAEQIDSSELNADCLFMIGDAYGRCDDMANATEYFNRSFEASPSVFTSIADSPLPWSLLKNFDDSIKGLEWFLAFACKRVSDSKETISNLIDKYEGRGVECTNRGDFAGAKSDQERLAQLKVKLNDLSHGT